MAQTPGGIYILVEDQSHLDLLTRFSKDLVSAPMDLSIVSRSLEYPGQRNLGSNPQSTVALDLSVKARTLCI